MSDIAYARLLEGESRGHLLNDAGETKAFMVKIYFFLVNWPYFGDVIL